MPFATTVLFLLTVNILKRRTASHQGLQLLSFWLLIFRIVVSRNVFRVKNHTCFTELVQNLLEAQIFGLMGI